MSTQSSSDLTELSYRELQALAKGLGIQANLKKSVLLEKISEVNAAETDKKANNEEAVSEAVSPIPAEAVEQAMNASSATTSPEEEAPSPKIALEDVVLDVCDDDSHVEKSKEVPDVENAEDVNFVESDDIRSVCLAASARTPSPELREDIDMKHIKLVDTPLQETLEEEDVDVDVEETAELVRQCQLVDDEEAAVWNGDEEKDLMENDIVCPTDISILRGLPAPAGKKQALLSPEVMPPRNIHWRYEDYTDVKAKVMKGVYSPAILAGYGDHGSGDSDDASSLSGLGCDDETGEEVVLDDIARRLDGDKLIGLPTPEGKKITFASPDLNMGKKVYWRYEDYENAVAVSVEKRRSGKLTLRDRDVNIMAGQGANDAVLGAKAGQKSGLHKDAQKEKKKGKKKQASSQKAMAMHDEVTGGGKVEGAGENSELLWAGLSKEERRSSKMAFWLSKGSHSSAMLSTSSLPR